MRAGLGLALASSLALSSCNDLPSYPSYGSPDAGQQDIHGAFCKENKNNYSVSRPPSNYVKDAIFNLLQHIAHVFDPNKPLFSANIDDLREDLAERLTKAGFTVLADIHESGGVEENKECLDHDLVGAVLDKDPLIEGKRGKTKKAILVLLEVTMPDGQKAKAGVEVQVSSLAGETGEKVAAILAGRVDREEGCDEWMVTNLGPGAYLSVTEEGSISTMSFRGWELNIGSAEWTHNADDGTTVWGTSYGEGSVDQCYGDEYAELIGGYEDDLKGFLDGAK